ncbi:MAG: mevalonate kinase [Tepidisphaerales bacterium]
MIIETHAYARAGLCGNPSDGYYGKTISFSIRNFKTTVKLWESPRLEILQTDADHRSYGSLGDLMRDLKLYGYYGGERLIKAAIRTLVNYARKTGQPLHDRNFTIAYSSDVPRLVGLSGSSAIVVATMKALMQFYNLTVPKPLLPTLVLSAEKDELKISAGLQDRVIQVYEGMVYMDFDKEHLTKHGYGIYEELRPNPMPPLYVSYDPKRAEISDITHRNLREAYDRGDETVHRAMQRYRELTTEARSALLAGDWEKLAACSNAGFDLRRTIMDIAPENLRMVETARKVGASSAFAGSGGAVCGVYFSGPQYQELCDEMARIGCTTLRPLVFPLD